MYREIRTSYPATSGFIDNARHAYRRERVRNLVVVKNDAIGYKHCHPKTGEKLGTKFKDLHPIRMYQRVRALPNPMVSLTVTGE